MMLRATSLCVCILTTTSAAGPPDVVPKAIEPPSGNARLLEFEAKGVQIYKAVAGKDGRLSWMLEAPLAELHDSGGRWVGRHYEGPSWEADDGSKLVRDKAHEIRSTPAPRADRDVPWLLIKVTPADQLGMRFNSVAYVQRINTHGGKPPSDAPRREGAKVGTPYTATYRFFGLEK
jgi:hypothetical protein